MRYREYNDNNNNIIVAYWAGVCLCARAEEKAIGGPRKGKNALGTRRCNGSRGLHFSLCNCTSRRRRSFLFLLLFIILRDITLTIITANVLYTQTLIRMTNRQICYNDSDVSFPAPRCFWRLWFCYLIFYLSILFQYIIIVIIVTVTIGRLDELARIFSIANIISCCNL